MKDSSSPDPFDLKAKFPRYIFLDPNFIESVSTVFNPNEYDASLQKGIDACWDRYGAVVIYANNTIAEINKCRIAGFITDLDFINKSLPLKRNAFCELNCPSVRANFEALLFAVKSLLDVLCRYLLSRKIGQSLRGFNKTRKEGREIIGGRVLNALRNISHSRLPSRDELLDLIEEHKVKWIDELVGMRDTVTHTSGLQNFVGFWMIIEGGRTNLYTEVDILDPMLNHGGGVEAVEKYCQLILTHLQAFTINFRDMLFPSEERKATLAELGK